jgi:membrane protein YdbS with pleckstrin-like domain
MENFSNETIDTTQLKFRVQFLFRFRLLKVTLLNVFFFFLIVGSRPWSIVVFQQGLLVFAVGISAAYFLFFSCFYYRDFKKKGFAFRTHDVLFRHGVIATNTIVIPYNRVQHVALHEGLVSGILD